MGAIIFAVMMLILLAVWAGVIWVFKEVLTQWSGGKELTFEVWIIVVSASLPIPPLVGKIISMIVHFIAG